MVEVRQVSVRDVPRVKRQGRPRKPSQFDGFVGLAYREWLSNPEFAWYAVPYDGTKTTLKRLKRELDRAVQHIGKGRETRTGLDRWGQPTMWYQVREKRARKAGK